MSAEFADRVVLVTGGSTGIGRAAALRFGQRGALVVIASRRAEAAEAVVETIRDAGGRAQFIRVDVSDPQSIAHLIGQTIRQHGRLDCAFNNAGTPGETFRDSAAQTVAAWDEVIDVNLRGVWLCMKYELAHMRDRGTGCIVNTASVFGHVGSDFGIAPYVASKHGVIGLTRAAALEFARSGVRVNAISPGLTLTEMSRPGYEADPVTFDTNVRQSVPLGRIAEPEDIAGAAVWLCSDEARYVTGTTLIVDGGLLAR
jgi:NAD(P)-dependent dehydrogenase (short-subunit alcohol dehydrogenase family)